MPTRYDSIADGLRTCLGKLTFPIIQRLVDDILLADEDSIRAATRLMAQRARVVAEPSGAVPLACLMRHRDRFEGKTVALVVSGGNFDVARMAEW
jgi:threonine dehydratase